MTHQYFREGTLNYAESSARHFNSCVDVLGNKHFEANELVSTTSGVNSPSESKIQNACLSVAETSLVSLSSDQINFDVTNSVPDLTCTENLSYEDYTEESSNPQTASQLQLDSFQDYSDPDFYSSEYSPSMFLESGSEFSERTDEDLFHSPTFSLLLEYREKFCKSIYPLNVKAASEFASADKDVLNYSDANELQQDTLFLGINLMDRFLSIGFFKEKVNLQLVGIACLTLASRIEENQRYNSVQQKTFQVGSTMHTRTEVVAMEWLVQEVLNFQCLLPSIYNFLWFYLKAAKASEEIETTVKHLAVLSILGHEQLSFWPSTVAASLVIIVATATNQKAAYHRVMKTHIRTEKDDLRDCIKSLQGLITYVR